VAPPSCLSLLVWLCLSGLLTADEAAHHIGETATVCGTIASASYASHSKGQPTFLNLDKAYPNQTSPL